MKLNISIYTDWLKDYQINAMIRSDKYEIETVRLFSKNQPLLDHVLYVGRMKDLFHTTEDKVICTHKNDIIIVETDDLQAVFNDLLNARDFYENWKSNMMDLISSDSVLQDLVNLSEDILRYPLFLLDVGQRKQAVTQNHAPIDDPLWDEMIMDGSASTDILININKTFPDRTRKKGIYQLPESFFPNRDYHRNFFLNDEYIGCAIMLDTDHNLSTGALSLFNIFCDFVDNWYQIHIQNQEQALLKSQICHAITDKAYNYTELHYLLNLRDWKMDDTLILMQLISPYEKFHFNHHMCHVLESHFSNLIAITMDHSICVLCNVTHYPWEKLKNDITPWVSGSRYFASISPKFHLSDAFYEFYQYTELTLAYCDKVPGTFYDGKNILFKHMMKHFQQSSMIDITHPAHRLLREYDATHHTELASTLYTYLKLERNSTATAQVLNMHRNSLAYRLKQIDQLINVNLEDYYERMLILLSFELE